MVHRVAFLLISMLVGLGTGIAGELPAWLTPLTGGLIGGVLGCAVLGVEYGLQRLAFPRSLGGGLGFGVGVLFGGVLAGALSLIFPPNDPFAQLGAVIILCILPYIGLVLGLQWGGWWFGPLPGEEGARHSTEGSPKLVDTSAIIDGRIADLCDTGFMEGGLIIPQFILQELQAIADSSDGLKRARGRRGLDVLNHIQKSVNVDVHIIEDDFPHIKEVDAKLVELAKKRGAKIMTNDFNLNKVAELQGVKVLNVNELCNALKPVVLPGEPIRVFVLKEGKESGQGVAYLDDGTMVVVDNAKRCIGKNVDVVVTSVLQTSAGRMIFTRLKDEPERDVLSFARG